MASLRAYVLTRILLTIPMIFILLTVVFLVMRVLPGNPVIAMVGMKASEEQIRQLMHQLGLDKPLWRQYLDYLSKVLRGDLGNSMIWGRRPVIDEIMDHFPATIELTISGFAVSVLLGIVTGTAAGLRRGTGLDLAMRVYSIVVYALFIPWLGMMLQYVFGVKLGWFPVGGRIGPMMEPEHVTGLYVLDSILTLNWGSLASALRYLTLPSLTLGVVLSGVYTRLVRTSLSEVLEQDFIRAARSRGVSERVVLFRHALKNAFIPILTMMGLQFALLLAGAVLTETTFSWPGMGTFLMERIIYRDFTTVQGTIVFYALFVALVSLLVDLIYAYIDPRIRY
ncbi:MAG: ABC transporter permease [Candidatus Korarchaeota archaeon]|nr:ABC transporter permease [Candidatus Korarchaeota archaeon]